MSGEGKITIDISELEKEIEDLKRVLSKVVQLCKRSGHVYQSHKWYHPYITEKEFNEMKEVLGIEEK
jgi:predicted metal-dependent hydrolase